MYDSCFGAFSLGIASGLLMGFVSWASSYILYAFRQIVKDCADF